MIGRTKRNEGLLLALIPSPLHKSVEVYSLLDALWRWAYGDLRSHYNSPIARYLVEMERSRKSGR